MARTDQRALPIALMVAAAVLLVARFAWTPAPPKGSLIHWVSPAEGIVRARETGKPILYDFTAEWCRPCHMLDEEVFADPVIASGINDRFIAVRVVDRKQEEGRNAPEVEALQQRYVVRGFPTVVFADANGSEQARMEGFRGRDRFEQLMESLR